MGALRKIRKISLKFLPLIHIFNNISRKRDERHILFRFSLLITINNFLAENSCIDARY